MANDTDDTSSADMFEMLSQEQSKTEKHLVDKDMSSDGMVLKNRYAVPHNVSTEEPGSKARRTLLTKLVGDSFKGLSDVGTNMSKSILNPLQTIARKTGLDFLSTEEGKEALRRDVQAMKLARLSDEQLIDHFGDQIKGNGAPPIEARLRHDWIKAEVKKQTENRNLAGNGIDKVKTPVEPLPVRPQKANVQGGLDDEHAREANNLKSAPDGLVRHRFRNVEGMSDMRLPMGMEARRDMIFGFSRQERMQGEMDVRVHGRAARVAGGPGDISLLRRPIERDPKTGAPVREKEKARGEARVAQVGQEQDSRRSAALAAMQSARGM